MGIAFGMNPRKQAIGDVLVSDSIRGYELARANPDGTITPRGDKPPASPTLLNRLLALWHRIGADPDACMTWPTLRFGCALSGNKLIVNLDYRNSLLAIEQKAIGGEMEAVGIQLAAHRHDVHWIAEREPTDGAELIRTLQAWRTEYRPETSELLFAYALRDAATGAALRVLAAYQGEVLSCAFAPDGRSLLSAGGDGTLRLWDAATGAALRVLAAYQGEVLSCAFAPDGRWLLSAGTDGTLRLWDAETGEQLRIHAIFGRTLAGQPQRRLEGGHAVWEPGGNRLIEATGDAWRWLKWVRTGADGWPEPLPLETFGPMPAPKRLRVVVAG